MNIPDGKTTNWLGGAIATAFILSFFLWGIDYSAVFGGFIPLRASGGLAVPGGVPVWLTPLTAAFLHAGLLHLSLNMVMLLFCGRFVEKVLGGKLLLLLFLIGAYAAAATEFLFHPSSDNPMIGASGAISAIIGTYALLFSQQEVRAIGFLSANAVRILWLAAAWTIIQIMIGIVSLGGIGRIAIGAHIGGFVAGLLLTKPMVYARFKQRK
ncbi:rhomboid family intramembrane serine protease [Rhizorhapis suberifaciens]|uniref:Membrane associated rhomboid family serine protease n=1 Tax=Rhizorhapis suberifaciens TaxID=13656 RepID=A0A840HR63_9SPHN|nr:rhomboid family intramembrane serine protease [Rhizorhapis suberifaciens]MBB4640044.1 membrane associated rhomboid family serine protease [Rhizorhapis suberifaciens]